MHRLKWVKAKLKERFILHWNRHMNSEVGMDKLRTYKMIKHKFELKIFGNFIRQKVAIIYNSI